MNRPSAPSQERGIFWTVFAGWMRFARFVERVIFVYVLSTILYVMVLGPLALLMRILPGRPLARLERPGSSTKSAAGTSDADTYWIGRAPGLRGERQDLSRLSRPF